MIPAACVAFCLSSSVSLAGTFDCKIATSGEAQGWIAQEIKVEHGEKVFVTDDIILYTAQKAVEGKLSRENANVIVFTWEVRSKDITNQEVRMTYRLTVQKANGAAQISATPLGYANSFMAQGACTTA
ncbi:MAG: hypothetical protein CFE34_12615 [Rhodobacteraceae bacterium PARR1]|nr:MAG: hypothetical protein CFE34_12615 [Rhodobacteraceae bacterium PARR1]